MRRPVELPIPSSRSDLSGLPSPKTLTPIPLSDCFAGQIVQISRIILRAAAGNWFNLVFLRFLRDSRFGCARQIGAWMGSYGIIGETSRPRRARRLGRAWKRRCSLWLFSLSLLSLVYLAFFGARLPFDSELLFNCLYLVPCCHYFPSELVFDYMYLRLGCCYLPLRSVLDKCFMRLIWCVSVLKFKILWVELYPYQTVKNTKKY